MTRQCEDTTGILEVSWLLTSNNNRKKPAAYVTYPYTNGGTHVSPNTSAYVTYPYTNGGTHVSPNTSEVRSVLSRKIEHGFCIVPGYRSIGWEFNWLGVLPSSFYKDISVSTAF
uniref:Uncharacterized protein n=1 Tax=Daucus carota subsp. sativus TaxID=79200 RepID=A0A166F310_DAUCS